MEIGLLEEKKLTLFCLIGLIQQKMKLKLIISILLFSECTSSQVSSVYSVLDLFSGYSSFYINNHEEGVFYSWFWKENGFIIISEGLLTDLVFPNNYTVYNTYNTNTIETFNALDSTTGFFARKERYCRHNVVVQYCDFKDSTGIDSLSCLVYRFYLGY